MGAVFVTIILETVLPSLERTFFLLQLQLHFPFTVDQEKLFLDQEMKSGWSHWGAKDKRLMVYKNTHAVQNFTEFKSLYDYLNIFCPDSLQNESTDKKLSTFPYTVFDIWQQEEYTVRYSMYTANGKNVPVCSLDTANHRKFHHFISHRSPMFSMRDRCAASNSESAWPIAETSLWHLIYLHLWSEFSRCPG